MTINVDVFCIASNSFHGCLPELPKNQFVHLITQSLEEGHNKNISNALILAAASKSLYKSIH
jgi:hypothetical protein